jgi:hypothetical protein
MIARTFLAIAALIVAVTTYSTNQLTFAQETSKQVAVKFDEFGDILLTDIKARLDNFTIQIQNEPNTRAFIIVYRSQRDLPGANTRFIAFTKSYLVDARGIEAERIVIVDGGIASCLIREFWIVPIGATPKPRDDVHVNWLEDTASTYKFDEYYYSLPEDGDEIEPNDFEAYVKALRKQPRSRAYIIAYPQYYLEQQYKDYDDKGIGRHPYKRVHLDRQGTAQRMLKTERDALVKEHHISPSRIVTVNGGYRKVRQVELWIVPRGEHAPIATPNAFPKLRAKHRTIRRR